MWEDPLRTGKHVEKFGVQETPVGAAWREHLDGLSFGDSPVMMFCEPLSANLWMAFGEFINKFRRKAQEPKMIERYEAILKVVSRIPAESVLMDALNWMWELENHSLKSIYDDDTRGIMRDHYEEFIRQVLVEGKAVL